MGSPVDISLNSSYLLNTFLFHLRTPLHGIKSASQIAKQYPEKVHVSVHNWLKEWTPVVDAWISAEANAHLYKDGKEHNWKQIVFEMAENMKDADVACDEAQNFEIPESDEGKMVVELTKHGIEYVNKIIQLCRSKDYEGLLKQ
jgi:hypothetical protein